MGKRWRRINERLRQHIIAPHFQPASIERNQMMFREASTYFQHFKTIIRKLTRLMKDYEDMTHSVHTLLECRVPRLYMVESDGSVGPELLDGDAFLGAGIQVDRLTSAAQSLQTRMSEEVISTIQQWFKSYDRCKVLLNELNELKYELDSRRRTVLSLDFKKTDVQGKLQKGDKTTKDIHLAETSEKLKHKERKHDLCLAEFQHKEEELNQALRALLSEVRILAELVGHVFQILSDAPQDAHRAFKEGTASGIQQSIHVKQQKRKKETRKEPKPELKLDPSNPFLTPP